VPWWTKVIQLVHNDAIKIPSERAAIGEKIFKTTQRTAAIV